MPPKETNGDWLCGGFVPYDDFPVIGEGFIMTDEEVKQYECNPPDFTNMTFTATGYIKFTRRLLKIVYTGRRLRREIRKLEKERRKRLKEVTGDE